MTQKGNTTILQRLTKDYFAADIDRSKCLHAMSWNVLFCTHYVGNVIFHEFLNDDVSYRVNGENISIMLE